MSSLLSYKRYKSFVPILIILVSCCLLKSSGAARTSLSERVNHGEEKVFREAELKAVYLYNFLHFVQWPTEKCGEGNEHPREIAVIGEAPLGQALLALQAKLEATQKKRLSIVFYGPYEEGMDLSGCRLLFISDSEKNNFHKILAALEDEPVLTVADNDHFLSAGGIITLISRKNKIRWAINRDSARRAGLRLSSKLLDIAVKVIEGP